MPTTLAPSPVAARVAADLLAIREQWGDLLAAIERPPAAEWPPREARGFLDQAATDDHDDEPEQDEPPLGRPPLTIREHPAPLNLDALDAALAVERALFTACDALAAQLQRPVRCIPVALRSTQVREDRADATDPARWHLPTVRDIGRGNAASAGSRAHGLHWAAVWLEGRALDEPHGDLFTPIPPRTLDALADVARLARARVERALQRDGRTTDLPDPCPWCAGELTGQTRPGGEPVVTCQRGEACPAPVLLDRRRRTWRGADLVGLWVAMEAARERGEEEQQG